MTHVPTPRVSEIIGRSIDPQNGATAHHARCGSSRGRPCKARDHAEEFSKVAVKNHANAVATLCAFPGAGLAGGGWERMVGRSAAALSLLSHLGRAAVVLSAEPTREGGGHGQGTDTRHRYRSDSPLFAPPGGGAGRYRMAGPPRKNGWTSPSARRVFAFEITRSRTPTDPRRPAGGPTLEGPTAWRPAAREPLGRVKARGHPLPRPASPAGGADGSSAARPARARWKRVRLVRHRGLATNNWICSWSVTVIETTLPGPCPRCRGSSSCGRCPTRRSDGGGSAEPGEVVSSHAPLAARRGSSRSEHRSVDGRSSARGTCCHGEEETRGVTIGSQVAVEMDSVFYFPRGWRTGRDVLRRREPR